MPSTLLLSLCIALVIQTSSSQQCSEGCCLRLEQKIDEMNAEMQSGFDDMRTDMDSLQRDVSALGSGSAAGGDCNPTPDGSQYTGHVSVTVSGKRCQSWASQTPHSHTYNQDDMFPDAGLHEASNYCRNPSNYAGGLWCYTMDPETRWETCDVPDCSGGDTQGGSEACPASFKYNATVNGCYKVVNRNLNWADAGKQCRSQYTDAHLVVIRGPQEQAAVAALLSSPTTTKTGCYTHGTYGMIFWTAGQRTDPTTESEFIWRVKDASGSVVDESAMTYTNWFTGRPNYHNSNQACMQLYGADHDYKWNDGQCSTARCFVCEIDL